jgi:acetoin utilization deacetylase AcuC-like enzyme
LKIVYSDRYLLDIGAHVFPTEKYGCIRDAVVERGLVSPEAFIEPVPAAWDTLALVHTPGYLEKLRHGLSWEDQAELELPWSPDVVEGFRLMAGGTLLAAEAALDSGQSPESGTTRHAIAVHLGGGFHHAFPDHGEGFCMFNDVAVAIRALLAGGRIQTAAIVDCDVHQGNGTAAIFAGDPRVFTFSVHQMRNYPSVKPHGSLDVGLPDATLDIEYLQALRQALPAVMAFKPDVVFYLAGADPFDGDQLGGLSLTKDGLRKRDRTVFAAARQADVPVVVTLAGGYARRLDDTVDIHVATVEEAVRSGVQQANGL